MKKVLSFYISIVVAFLLFGCDKSNEPNYNELKSIVQQKYNKNIDTVFRININNRDNIIAVLNDNSDSIGPKCNNLIILVNFANAWQEEYNYPKEFIGHPEITDMTITKIGTNSYFYFTEEDVSYYGQQGGFIKFNLLRLSDYKLFTIEYTGESPYSSMNQIVQELKEQTDLISFLEKKISESLKIRKSSPSDTKYDINAPKNCLAKWELDNSNCLSLNKIKLTFYDKNLFEVLDEGGSRIGAIENDSYKVVAYFRAILIGFNKKTNKYFVIYSSSNRSADFSGLEFVDGNTLAFYSDIDLSFNFITNEIKEFKRSD